MADNVNITAGAGVVIHADEYTHTTLGAGKTQLVKLVDGTLDSDTPITVDIGAKANALRIAPANDITDATYIGDIKFGEALPAGTNAIGKLAANTGVDIGDVDVLSLPAVTIAAAQTLATVTTVGTVTTITNVVHVDDNSSTLSIDDGAGAITVDWAGTAPPIGAGTEATALRVTLATDSTGVVSVDDNGSTLTVDGTVTANLSAVDNAVLDTIDAVLDTINAKLVTGTVIGDVNLGATDNAVLDAIAASLVTIDSDTNDIKTATEIIDDWDAVHDSAASSDGPQIMAVYDSTKPTAVGDGDAVRVLADEYGRLLEGVEKTAWQAVYDSADASGEGETIKASAASTILVVQSYTISVDAEMWVKLQDEASTALTGKLWLKAGGGESKILPKSCPIILGTDKDLEVISEGAGNISVSATGYTIPG